jgi:CUB/sushi domain-containing protein
MLSLLYQVSTVQTTTDLIRMVGTIKSPNYPASSYPNSSDYRWKIVTQPNTSIRLQFALFETQEKFDFVSVRNLPHNLKIEKKFYKLTCT